MYLFASSRSARQPEILKEMKKKSSIKINLTDAEKKTLRGKKMKISDLVEFDRDEIEVLLDVPFARAQEIHALAEFQTVPSVGIKFAEDLVFLGFYSLDELKTEDAAKLVEAYEKKKGYWIDPCVEDQFRLMVHFAKYADYSKKWWDFTAERKQYRLENGYPADRPNASWVDVLGIIRK